MLQMKEGFIDLPFPISQPRAIFLSTCWIHNSLHQSPKTEEASALRTANYPEARACHTTSTSPCHNSQPSYLQQHAPGRHHAFLESPSNLRVNGSSSSRWSHRICDLPERLRCCGDGLRYTAAGATWGTVFALTASWQILGCNAAFGLCSAAGAAIALGPTPINDCSSVRLAGTLQLCDMSRLLFIFTRNRMT
jgi:hypothetical protein